MATQATNINTNPSFEAVLAGTPVLRTNLYDGTRALTATLTGNVLTKDITVNGLVWDRYTQGSGSTSPIYRAQAPLASLVQGAFYTTSATVYNESAFPVTLVVDWVDQVSGNSTHTLQPGETRRVTASGSKAIYDATFRFMDILITTLNGSLLIREILIEQTDQLRTFFDGNTPDSRGWDYGWTGTAGASTSTAKATGQEIRRNWHINPTLFSTGGSTLDGGAIYNANSLAGTITTTGGIQRHQNVVFTASGQRYGAYIASTPGYITGATAASAVTVSFTLPTALPTNIGAKLYVDFRDSTGIVGTAVASAVPGNVGRISGTLASFTRAPTEYTAYLWIENLTASVTAVDVPMSEPLIEFTTISQPFFSGSSNSAGDYIYRWLGTANASASIQQAPALTGTTMGNGVAYQSRDWFTGPGVASVRLTPTSTSTATTLIIGGFSGTNIVPLTAGKTYTLLATRRLAAPITGTLSTAYAGRAALIVVGGTGAGTFSSDQILANVAGTDTLRWTFTIPADATSITLRLGHGGAVGTGDVWWDNVLVTEGTYTGIYFDGDTPNTPFITYAWTGSPHASTTTMSYTDLSLQTIPEPWGLVLANNSKGRMRVIYRSGWHG